MRRQEPPRPPRGGRAGPPGTSGPGHVRPSSARPTAGDDPYRTYQPYGDRASAPGPASRVRATQFAPSGTRYTAAPVAAAHNHHGFTLFHDGNAGHLWRAEVASVLGESIFAVGVLLWLLYLTGSLTSVLLGALLLALPALLAGPLAVPLQNVVEPGPSLRWLGRIRVLLTLGLVVMHFRTVFPVVYLLIFGVALCGRLRQGARVAAQRTCLAPGEPERVANDLYIGGALMALLGPLLAVFSFILLGERILLVSVASAAFFLLATNSDSFLDALPPQQRAFLLAAPPREPETAEERALAAAAEEDLEDEPADEETAAQRRELALPEWYQQGPATVAQGIGEIRAGLALAGGTRASALGMALLGILAFAGGGLSVLDYFFVRERLGLPPFYIGPLLAAQAAGLVVGAWAAHVAAEQSGPRRNAVLGVLGSGLALAAMALAPVFPLTLVAAVGLGAANAVALGGARDLLLRGHTGPERRAIASAEAAVLALCAVVGIPLAALFYRGAANVPALARLVRLFPGWHVAEVYLGLGVSLIVAACLGGLLLLGPERRRRRRSGKGGRAAGKVAARDDDWDAPEDGWDDEAEWDDDAPEEWDDDAPETGGYPAPRGRYDDEDEEYDPPPPPASRRGESRTPPRRMPLDRSRWH